jgi:hypothetical protein
MITAHRYRTKVDGSVVTLSIKVSLLAYTWCNVSYRTQCAFLIASYFFWFFGGRDIFDFILCSNQHSFQFLTPVSSLLNVFQCMVEFRFSLLFCRCLSSKINSDVTVTYILYQFFLISSHFSSKSVVKHWLKKRLNAVLPTCWKCNNKTSTESTLLHYAAKILSYLYI